MVFRFFSSLVLLLRVINELFLEDLFLSPVSETAACSVSDFL